MTFYTDRSNRKCSKRTIKAVFFCTINILGFSIISRKEIAQYFINILKILFPKSRSLWWRYADLQHSALLQSGFLSGRKKEGVHEPLVDPTTNWRRHKLDHKSLSTGKWRLCWAKHRWHFISRSITHNSFPDILFTYHSQTSLVRHQGKIKVEGLRRKTRTRAGGKLPYKNICDSFQSEYSSLECMRCPSLALRNQSSTMQKVGHL
jgi:hypothetical protein